MIHAKAYLRYLLCTSYAHHMYYSSHIFLHISYALHCNDFISCNIRVSAGGIKQGTSNLQTTFKYLNWSSKYRQFQA